MSVKLVSYTQSCSSDEQSMQDIVAYCARVSNPQNQNNTDTSEKLLKYLAKNKHWSPFEMVSICLEIETTRDIARQLLRHRSFSFQEFSQRYAIADIGFDVRQARLQDKKNRQNSIVTDDEELMNEWERKQNELIEHAKSTYDWAINKGIAKEQARVVLPEGNTMSRLYMNGTLRSWIHYVQLRASNGTQKEHQTVALACAKEIARVFPMFNDIVNLS